MRQLSQQALLFLLETVHQIHQKTGELIIFLEHALQESKPQDSTPREDYDPDAYLAQWIDKTNVIASSQKEISTGNDSIGGDSYD